MRRQLRQRDRHFILLGSETDIHKRKYRKNASRINKARLKLIAMTILALCKVQTVSFHKLALAFDSECKADSSLIRPQRFIADFSPCTDLIARLIFGLLPEKTNWKLVICRANWKFGEQNINIFMLGTACRGVAFHLMFSLLDKRGNSNRGEHIAPLDRFINLFGKECVDCTSADREFVAEKRMAYLNREQIRYYLRIVKFKK